MLAVVRFAALFAGAACVAAVLRDALGAGLAAGTSLLWTAGFLCGLRLRAGIAYVRGRPAKELSWSSALLMSFGAVAALQLVTGGAAWLLVFAVLALEALAFYAIGKATCAVSGCCSAARPLPGGLGLPAYELIATLCVVACALPLLLLGETGTALSVMILGHLLTRGTSRVLRAGTFTALAAPDIGTLSVAAVGSMLLR